MLVRDIPLHTARVNAVDHAFSVVPTEAASGADRFAFLNVIETLAAALVQSTPTARRLHAAVVLTLLVELRFHLFEGQLQPVEPLRCRQHDSWRWRLSRLTSRRLWRLRLTRHKGRPHEDGNESDRGNLVDNHIPPPFRLFGQRRTKSSAEPQLSRANQYTSLRPVVKFHDGLAVRWQQRAKNQRFA